MDLDGTEFNVLHRFSGVGDGQFSFTALLEASDGYLYGTTLYGLVRSLSGGKAGVSPAAGLIQLADGRFYGTTAIGGLGSPGVGVVFRLTLRER